MEGRNRWGDRSSVEAEVDGEAAGYGEAGVERKL